MVEIDVGEAGESQLLRCVSCGTIRPARETKKSGIMPIGSSSVCVDCASDEFETLVLVDSTSERKATTDN